VDTIYTIVLENIYKFCNALTYLYINYKITIIFILLINFYILFLLDDKENFFEKIRIIIIIAKAIVLFKKKKYVSTVDEVLRFKFTIIDRIWVIEESFIFFIYHVSFVRRFKDLIRLDYNIFLNNIKIHHSILYHNYLLYKYLFKGLGTMNFFFFKYISLAQFTEKLYYKYSTPRSKKIYGHSYFEITVIARLYYVYTLLYIIQENSLSTNIRNFYFWLKQLIFRYLLNKYNSLKETIMLLYRGLLFLIRIIIWPLKIIFKLWRYIMVAFIVSFYYLLTSIFFTNINISQQLGVWYIILIVFFWLLLGFVDFLNKYKNGKYTTAVQKFWKKTIIIFWLIEIFLFILFFYYYLNSSQEPAYMYDFYNLNCEFLSQCDVILQTNSIILLIIFFNYILINNINYYNNKQNYILLLIITLLTFYILIIESYQFFYIITSFSEKYWNFSPLTNSWIIDDNYLNIRVKQQYFIMCLMAKYWHFIFIFISWFFTIINILNNKKINYSLLSSNLQNYIILYILNFSCLIQFLNFFLKKYIELYYNWFFFNFDDLFIECFYHEIINYYFYLFN